MLEREKIMDFSRHWINSWNEGDLSKIMSHYAEDVDFSSPLVVQRFNRTTGKIVGADELRRYFDVSLRNAVKPRFTLESVAIGPDAFVLHYKNHRGQSVSEVFYPDAEMRISKVSVCWR